MKEVRIGFWRSETEKDLPMPEPSTPRRDQRRMIKALEASMKAGRMIAYKGFSTCRICGHPNGSQELAIIRGRTKYVVPEGYLHYLKDHDVGYDLRLIRALRLEELQ